MFQAGLFNNEITTIPFCEKGSSEFIQNHFNGCSLLVNDKLKVLSVQV